jgi:CBS domain-containing protein
VTVEPIDRSGPLRERARFLSRVDPFRGLGPEEQQRLAASVVERFVPSGEAVLVEYGIPGTELFVVREGTFDLVHNEVPVDVITAGEVFGHPTLLTGLPPEFTTRAREDSTLYCIPMDVALDYLSRLEGVRFVARTLRERLTHAANTMHALPDVRTRPVTALLQGAPLFCGPDVSIREAADLMIAGGRSAILVQARGELGIVTDVDLRDKVVAPGGSGEAAVSSIMSVPVTTIGADVLAAEAAIAMMEAGVNHMPVVDSGGQVLGILSASSLMSLETLSPFALRRSLLSARTVDDLVAASADVPKLFTDLIDAHLDAPAVTRILTLLSEAATTRLIELSFERYGGPPVDYSWLAFGSTARSELTLASDQDNGLAYADTDDPAVGEYFRRVAQMVNEGLRLCGFDLDTHGVLAQNDAWRMAVSQWISVFTRCLGGWDNDRLLRAAIAFDFRQVSGDLSIVPQLADIVRETPRHARFKAGLADLGSEIRSPLGFRQRLVGPIDIKKSGLMPIQNMARYYAFTGGITAPTTLERLVAVEEKGGAGSESSSALREAFVGMSLLRLRHHAEGLRAGRAPDDAIDTADLRPLTRVTLREALRVVAAAQRQLPQRPA